MAIRGASFTLHGPRLFGSGFDRDDLSAIIVAALRAQIMRPLQLAAIRALLECLDRQRMMAAAHVPPRRRGFSLGDGHVGTCSIRSK
jgi:hypothetical protein